jgi:hypothetical protein
MAESTTVPRKPDAPSENAFWQHYNSRLELPTSGLISLLTHVLILGTVATLYFVINSSAEDKESVPIRLVEGGDDDAGLGNADARGSDEPLVKGDNSSPTMADVAALALPTDLPQVQKDFTKIVQLDPNLATVNPPSEKAPAYAKLSDALQKKLLPVGSPQGRGGNSDGPAGIGSDATKARSLRWIMRFKTLDGRDYLNQLAGFGAIVIVPVPPENSSAYVFRDLANPRPGEQVSEAEWQKLAQQVQFCDFKQDSVRQVTAELGLSQLKAQMFWAFFPKSIEEEMAKKERSYQNRAPESIQETVFEVANVGGKYEMRVVRQSLK